MSLPTHCRACGTRFGPGRYDAKRVDQLSHVCRACDRTHRETPNADSSHSPAAEPNHNAHAAEPSGGDGSALHLPMQFESYDSLDD